MTLTYNGISSTKYGLQVEQMNLYERAKQQGTTPANLYIQEQNYGKTQCVRLDFVIDKCVPKLKQLAAYKQNKPAKKKG